MYMQQNTQLVMEGNSAICYNMDEFSGLYTSKTGHKKTKDTVIFHLHGAKAQKVE